LAWLSKGGDVEVDQFSVITDILVVLVALIAWEPAEKLVRRALNWRSRRRVHRAWEKNKCG
jgi:hypothetical protein